MTALTTSAPVLVVCTGNLCRSPLAAALLAAGLPGAAVSSAGTRAPEGAAPPVPTRERALALGVDLDDHRARRLVEGTVGRAGLVLTAAREHRRTVVTLVPRATRVTFTLREFARLCVLVDPAEARTALDGRPPEARLRAAVALVAARRGIGPRSTPDDDDVVDPIGHGDSVYDRSTRQIVEAVDRVTHYLGAAVG